MISIDFFLTLCFENKERPKCFMLTSKDGMRHLFEAETAKETKNWLEGLEAYAEWSKNQRGRKSTLSHLSLRKPILVSTLSVPLFDDRKEENKRKALSSSSEINPASPTESPPESPTKKTLDRQSPSDPVKKNHWKSVRRSQVLSEKSSVKIFFINTLIFPVYFVNSQYWAPRRGVKGQSLTKS